MTLSPVSVQLAVELSGDVVPALAVRRFELVERIDHPFEARIDIVSEDLDFDVRALLGCRATVELDRPGTTSRALGGVVTRAEYISTRSRQVLARVVVEPSLALLRYSRRRRIFADMTLPQVLDAVTRSVFETHGGGWDLSRLQAHAGERDYVVQYDESDLDFVLRLLAEAGISLLHGQGDLDDAGQLEMLYVLVDRNSMLPGYGMDPGIVAESKPWPVLFVPHAEEEAEQPSVQYLGRWDATHTQGTTVTARAWMPPGATRYESRFALADAPGLQGHAWIHHPGRIDEGGDTHSPRDDTDTWARRLLEEHGAGSVEVNGASNVADFTAGSTFELEGHPHVQLDRRYAVLSVVHHGDFPEVELGVDSNAPTYSNRFVAAPLDAGAVRPPLLPKPRVAGIEAATVIGPEDEEIHTDALGRVQVRFHWDDTPTGTCWLRVMSAWAGPGYGATFVPRVGMEVVVGFLSGDPDRPIVTGCVYTGANLPPGALPETKTCTVLRTQSSPGGDGFNELRFDDAAGKEEMFLRAQRNQRTLVKAEQSTRIGTSRTLNVGRDSSRTIGGCETVHVGTPGAEKPGELQVFVTGGELRTIGDVHGLATKSAFWTADEAIVANAEQRVCWSCTSGAQALDRPPSGGTVLTLEPKAATLEALQSIELRVGETSLKLTPSGIELHGDRIVAKANEQAWVAAPGGRLSCNGREAELSGGAGRESVVRLRAEALDCKTKLLMRQTAKSIVAVAQDRASTAAADIVFEGSASLTAKSVGHVTAVGASMDLHALAGEVDVKGARIKLNS